MKFLICLLFSLQLSSAPLLPPPSNVKLKINNAILTKVNDKTITVLDVMKRMDILFYKSYPDLAKSEPARFQFYSAQWKNVLTDMINSELILADATAKELKVTDGEVREEMEKRFGPNVLEKLEIIGLEYQEASEIVKNEMLVDRMSWYFVNSKVWQSVTPQLIRDSYKKYIAETSKGDIWRYRIITVKDKNTADKIQECLDTNSQQVTDLATLFPSCQISNLYETNSKNLSLSHKNILQTLTDKNHSYPIEQSSKGASTYRIFYLEEKQSEPLPGFDTLSNKIKDGLLNESYAQTHKKYIQRLKRIYTFDGLLIDEDFTPFSFE